MKGDPFHFPDLDLRSVFEFYRSNIIPFEKQIFDITALKDLLYNKTQLFCSNIRDV